MRGTLTAYRIIPETEETHQGQVMFKQQVHTTARSNAGVQSAVQGLFAELPDADFVVVTWRTRSTPVAPEFYPRHTKGVL